MLEDSVRKAETSNNTEATDSLEYRRLQSELIGVNQQRDKYVEQIRTLESQLKDQPPQSKIAPSRTPDRKASSNESKPRRQLLFTALAEKDDLKKIKGIGPVMERTLNELGVTSFKQLGEFNKDDVQRVSDVLDVFPGRIERDKWVPQARDRYQEKYGLKLT
jgi:predicted flap endonuclease-1-like 5' DNA nuclease